MRTWFWTCSQEHLSVSELVSWVKWSGVGWGGSRHVHMFTEPHWPLCAQVRPPGQVSTALEVSPTPCGKNR